MPIKNAIDECVTFCHKESQNNDIPEDRQMSIFKQCVNRCPKIIDPIVTEAGAKINNELERIKEKDQKKIKKLDFVDAVNQIIEIANDRLQEETYQSYAYFTSQALKCRADCTDNSKIWTQYKNCRRKCVDVNTGCSRMFVRSKKI